MRFSLLTLVLITLWIATAGLVWARRAPWGIQSTLSIAEFEGKYRTREQRGSFTSAPDGIRHLSYNRSLPYPMIFKYEPYEILFIFESKTYFAYLSDFGFMDDNRVFVRSNVVGKKELFVGGDEEDQIYVIWHRRHPEWWWGHFYRPEVWGLAVLTLVILVRVARSRKARAVVS